MQVLKQSFFNHKPIKWTNQAPVCLFERLLVTTDGCLYFDGGSGFFHAWDNVIDKCEEKMWLLINGNALPSDVSPDQPLHFTYQGNINVSSTYVGPPNKKGDAPRLNCKTAPGNCTVTGTVFMESSEVRSWPAEAQAIVAKAGPDL